MQTQKPLDLIPHQVEQTLVHQRAVDGYIDATAMCKAAGKNFADYGRLIATQEFLGALSSDMGIPISTLIISVKGGRIEHQGTWVHPDVAVHLAQWCSPRFAVAVSRWVRDWITGKLKPPSLPYHLNRYMANAENVPLGHFSMLNEIIIALIAPMESSGYTLPDSMLPDISTGQMFCKWLREVIRGRHQLAPDLSAPLRGWARRPGEALSG